MSVHITPAPSSPRLDPDQHLSYDENDISLLRSTSSIIHEEIIPVISVSPPPPPPSSDRSSHLLSNVSSTITASDHLKSKNSTKDSIKLQFIPHIDPSTGRPSFPFSPIERNLVIGEIVKMGRKADRLKGNVTDADIERFVAFKSKVVSRVHAELWCSKDGQVKTRREKIYRIKESF